MLDEGPEASHQFFTWRQVFFQPHPGARPVVQIAAVGGSIEGRRRVVARFTLEVFALEIVRAMELITILNHCHRHRGFVYQHARFGRRQENHRSGRPAAGGLGGGLLGVPPAGAGLRSSSRAALRVHPSLGLSGFPAVPHAARRTAATAAWWSRRFPGAMASTS